MSTKTQEKSGDFAKNTAARVVAVQAIYQNYHNKKPPEELVQEYLGAQKGVEIDENPHVLPDGALLKKLILGTCEHHKTLEEMIYAQSKKEELLEGETSLTRQFEPLLMAVLLCGAFEVFIDQDIDNPIIINDYVEISKGFFDGNESGLVNGVLDKLSKTLA